MHSYLQEEAKQEENDGVQQDLKLSQKQLSKKNLVTPSSQRDSSSYTEQKIAVNQVGHLDYSPRK